MSDGDSARVPQPLSEEDAARANLYALIGRLFYDAPDSMLLAELCRAESGSGDDGLLGRSWRALREASKSAYPVVLKQEYDNLFVGVGRSEVTPYTSHYITGSSSDRHLVRLREHLERLGLARRSAAFEVEDHVSGVCDVMRLLIEERHSLPEQVLFFREFAYQGMVGVCDAIEVATSAAFYRHVAQFVRAFMAVEREAFEMDDAEA